MTESADAALSLTNLNADGKVAVSPQASSTSNPQSSLTLIGDNVSVFKAPAAPNPDGQTFGALGGSRHIELQAQPCVFGCESSNVFVDEVHDSIVTIQPATGRKPGPPFSLLGKFKRHLAHIARRQHHICQVYL